MKKKKNREKLKDENKNRSKRRMVLGVMYEKRTSWLEYTISLENIEYKVKRWSVKIYTIMYNK